MKALRFAMGFVLLDAMLSFENLWPTLWPHPVMRLSFELCMAVLALTAWAAWKGRLDRSLLKMLAGLTTFWVIARYLDVTVSAVFGRQVNLYWDSRHVMSVLQMGGVSMWQFVAGGIAVVAVPMLLYAVTHRCWQWIALGLAAPARHAGPASRLARPTIGIVGMALLATFAAQGVGGRDTRWFFSMPVAPIIGHQVVLLARQLSPEAGERLTPSPDFAHAPLTALGGADVLVLFAESYGATTLDNPAQAAALAGPRARLLKAIEASGRQVVSARVRSPTFGGASWLAHSALLTGVDTHDPGNYELLLATDRPSLVSYFKSHGYRTVNWMPGIQSVWPEGSFYGFDRYGDAEHLGYRGPALGHWRIPDQASMALLDAQELSVPGPHPPRFVVFPTLASHAPFRPLAPYTPDWDRLLRSDAYSAEDIAAATAKPVSWLEPIGAYIESLDYTFEWLGDWLQHRAPRHTLTIVLGDHQPMGSVSGPGASWDVPVHVISDDARLLDRFVAQGFVPGLIPGETMPGGMHALTPLLLKVFGEPTPPTD